MKALRWIWVIIFLWAVLGVTADSLDARPQEPSVIVVHIKTVHFDLARCILYFTADLGQPDSTGKVYHKKKAKFAIDFDNGWMTKNGAKSLPLSEREAKTMDALFDKLLRQYAFDSVVWYEEGGIYPSATNERAGAK